MPTVQELAPQPHSRTMPPNFRRALRLDAVLFAVFVIGFGLFLLFSAGAGPLKQSLLPFAAFLLLTTCLAVMFLVVLARVSRFQRLVQDQSSLLRINTELRTQIDELSGRSKELEETLSKLKRDQSSTAEHIRFLAALVNAIPNPFFYKDSSGRYRLCNNAFSQQIFGQTPERIIGRSVTDLTESIPPALGQVYASRDEELLRSGGTQFYEAPVVCAAGGERQFLFSKAVFASEDGAPQGIIGVLADITEQKNAERALELSQQRLAEAMDQASLANWEYDVLCRQFNFGDRFYAQLGTTVAQQGGSLMAPETYTTRFVYPEDAQLVTEHLAASIAAADPEFRYQVEHRIVRADGESAWVVSRWRVVKDTSGRIVKIYGANQDITERKRAEEDLRKLRRAMEDSPVAVVVTDLCGSIQYVNPKFVEITGYSAADVMGRNPRMLKSGCHPPAFYQEMWNTLLNGNSWRGEICNRRKDGELVWESAAISPVRSDNGEITHFVAVKEDITARKLQTERLKRVQEALVQRETLLRTMTTAAPVAYLVVDDRNGEVLYYNQQFIDIWGLTQWQVRLRYGRARIHDLMPDCLALVADKVAFSDSYTPLEDQENRAVLEDEIELLDGRTLRRFSTQIRDPNDQYFGRLHSFEDITRRRDADRQLASSLKEKEILLREVYHRVKNNLQVISSLLNLQSGAIADPQILRLIRETQERVRSMALVHEKLYRAKDLSRIDFDDYTHQLVTMLARSYITDVRVDVRFDMDKVLLNLDTSVPCGLILNELITNALKYAFKPAPCVGRPPRITVSLKAGHTGLYQLKVTDNGIGLPAKVDIHNTSTLGLQVVTMLAEQLNGDVQVERQDGTTFVVSFREIKGGARAHTGVGVVPATVTEVETPPQMASSA